MQAGREWWEHHSLVHCIDAHRMTCIEGLMAGTLLHGQRAYLAGLWMQYLPRHDPVTTHAS